MSVAFSVDLDPKKACDQSSTLFDDFFNYTSTGLFTSITGSTGTTVADDTAGVDVVKLTTAATNNDIQGLATTKANFLPVAGQDMDFYTKLSFTQNSANSAAIMFFVASSTPTTTNASTPAVSYSGNCIYKLGAGTGTVWNAQGSNGSTKTTTASQQPAADGTYIMRMHLTNWDGLSYQATYQVNGVWLTDSNNVAIVHKVLYASLVKAKVGAIVVSAGAAEVLTVDYISAGKTRV